MFVSISACFCGCFHVCIFVLLPLFLFLRCCFSLFLFPFVFVSVCFCFCVCPWESLVGILLVFSFRVKHRPPPKAVGPQYNKDFLLSNLFKNRIISMKIVLIDHSLVVQHFMNGAKRHSWRREAPPTAEGGGSPGAGRPWGVLLYTCQQEHGCSMHLTATARMFYGRLGLIKVDGNNPQG